MISSGFGQWRRAGMEAQVVGLDIGACLARWSPPDGARHVIADLLVLMEGAAMQAFNRRDTDP